MPEENQNQATELFAKLCREVNRKLSRGDISESILDFIFDSIAVLIPYDRMGIALLEENGMLRLSWVKSRLPVTHLRESYAASMRGSSLQKMIDSRQPRILNNLPEYFAAHPQSESTRLILKDGIRSSLSCPLVANNQAIGIVFFSSAAIGTYKNDHAEIFLDIADELAVVVEQGRLRHLFDRNRKLSLPLARVIHDLRSPLAVIQGYIDISLGARWYKSLHPDVRSTFAVLRRHTQYMVELLNDLAEWKQLSECTPGSGVRSVLVPLFVEEMCALGRSISSRKEIAFHSEAYNLPDSACFNPAQVRRALDNLFSNAVKFSPRGTTVSFSVRKDYDHLVFTVRDQGPGIPKTELPLLFKDFSQTSVRPSEGEPSSGLGLAIVKSIVDLHGGEVTVRSEEGKGSEFGFWLPLECLSREEWEGVVL